MPGTGATRAACVTNDDLCGPSGDGGSKDKHHSGDKNKDKASNEPEVGAMEFATPPFFLSLESRRVYSALLHPLFLH